MSLSIDTDDVVAVLVGGEWTDVIECSFDIDAYEFKWQGRNLFQDPNVCASGFTFKCPNGRIMYGPLTAIQAVMTSVDAT